MDRDAVIEKLLELCDAKDKEIRDLKTKTATTYTITSDPNASKDAVFCIQGEGFKMRQPREFWVIDNPLKGLYVYLQKPLLHALETAYRVREVVE